MKTTWRTFIESKRRPVSRALIMLVTSFMTITAGVAWWFLHSDNLPFAVLTAAFALYEAFIAGNMLIGYWAVRPTRIATYKLKDQLDTFLLGHQMAAVQSSSGIYTILQLKHSLHVFHIHDEDLIRVAESDDQQPEVVLKVWTIIPTISQTWQAVKIIKTTVEETRLLESASLIRMSFALNEPITDSLPAEPQEIVDFTSELADGQIIERQA